MAAAHAAASPKPHRTLRAFKIVGFAKPPHDQLP